MMRLQVLSELLLFTQSYLFAPEQRCHSSAWGNPPGTSAQLLPVFPAVSEVHDTGPREQNEFSWALSAVPTLIDSTVPNV